MPRKPNGQGPVRVALVQMRMTDDVDRNLKEAQRRIEEAAKKGAQIVCLPELYRSLYFPQTEDTENFALAEPVPGPSSKAFGALAKKHKLVIVAPIFEKRAQGVYHNSALVFDADGSLAGNYRKMHIPDDPEFYEKFYFAPGDLGFPVFETAYGRLGILICWDQWFPEAARLASLRGAQILFYPTAIGHHTTVGEDVWRDQHHAWQTVQCGHAVANGVYLAAVNRVGTEGKLRFWGQSFLSNPFGKVLVRAGVEEETVVVHEVDFDEIDRVRHNWPFLRDRRIDAYSHLTVRVIDEIAKH